ncbi:NAD-dependent protein deacetylase [Marmoricola sp. URHB0036]|uniref:NAD-dependent protein deacetylase n=1 Tax=Marmoricola sp. URHB0036 TaxID=1298863 RepID=UPI0006875738|nr:NAD-dependent protein deacetylase [Marmoricola sp. URHB0036]
MAEAAHDLLDGRTVVLTGAGLSTDSGIPDYRGPGAPVRMPMTYQDFVASGANQQRYWARAHLGWSRMGAAEPNEGHRALARLEALGRVPFLITQNVDGLHERAGHQQLVALHGRISEVVCLDCGGSTHRTLMQHQLTLANPGWLEEHAAVTARPDGDVELEETSRFVVPACAGCGGRLKPHVVFFGENVPKERVLRCYDEIDDADALLVAGSSLTVMSGLRFVRHAAKSGLPVVIVNRGATRGDDLATVKVEAGCSEWLSAWAKSSGQRDEDVLGGLGDDLRSLA